MPKSNESPKINRPAGETLTRQNDGEIRPAVFFDSPQASNNACAQENAFLDAQNYLPMEAQNIASARELERVFSRESLNKLLLNLSRFLLGGLLAFESLNASGVLQNSINNFHWIALVITTGGAWFILEAILFYTRKNSSQTASNALMLAVVLSLYADTLGQVYKLFDKVIWYDRILHFFAGGVICGSIIFLFIRSLEHRGKIRLGRLGIAFFAWTTTVFLGLLYEFGEFILDLITGSNSLGGIADTMDDLLLNTSGSLFILAILVVYFYYVSRRSRAADKNSSTESTNT